MKNLTFSSFTIFSTSAYGQEAAENCQRWIGQGFPIFDLSKRNAAMELLYLVQTISDLGVLEFGTMAAGSTNAANGTSFGQGYHLD